jgi:hypothetical protein
VSADRLHAQGGEVVLHADPAWLPSSSRPFRSGRSHLQGALPARRHWASDQTRRSAVRSRHRDDQGTPPVGRSCANRRRRVSCTADRLRCRGRSAIRETPARAVEQVAFKLGCPEREHRIGRRWPGRRSDADCDTSGSGALHRQTILANGASGSVRCRQRLSGCSVQPPMSHEHPVTTCRGFGCSTCQPRSLPSTKGKSTV